MYPWQINQTRLTKPTIGNVLDLCAENYHLLRRLVPAISELSQDYSVMTEHESRLYLEILEQTPYTTVIHLTFCFDIDGEKHLDPDAVFRLYHDARELDVISIKQDTLPYLPNYIAPSLEDKWKLNTFVSKWLRYLLAEDYCFLSAHLVE